MSNELELVAPQGVTDLEISRPPAVVLQEAKKAADALRDVIANKKRPVIFNGEQYLEFEDWQTIGRFYGVTVKIAATRPVNFGDVIGFEAEAIVLHTGSGREVSRAEAMCLNDERNWKDKPLFQLRSMAQTRAGSKALRNVLAWVVVLAGYKPTPAEEMDGVIKPTIPQVRPRNDATMVQPPTDRYTGERQEDGAGLDVGGSSSLAPNKSSEPQQASDAPAPSTKSPSEFARQMADQMDDQYDEGIITNFVKYQGQKAYQKGCSPGYFDLEDGQGGLVRKFKYLDPSLDVTSGMKRVYYRTENFKGKTSYAVTKIEAIE